MIIIDKEENDYVEFVVACEARSRISKESIKLSQFDLNGYMEQRLKEEITFKVNEDFYKEFVQINEALNELKGMIGRDSFVWQGLHNTQVALTMLAGRTTGKSLTTPV